MLKSTEIFNIFTLEIVKTISMMIDFGLFDFTAAKSKKKKFKLGGLFGVIGMLKNKKKDTGSDKSEMT